MILVSYLKDGHEQLAFLEGNFLYDADSVHPELPSSMSMMLNYWEDYFPLAKALNESIKAGKVSANKGIAYESAGILSPVTQPTSFRQAYAFTQEFTTHQHASNLVKGQLRFFHFSNHHCLQGPGITRCMPDHLEKLDFSLQLAVVVSKFGRNVTAEEADDYIAGYMIMNALNANGIESGDISGMAKTNEFAVPFGPWLVTPDELEPFKIETKPEHTGNSYNLYMICSVNNELVCEASSSEMEWTFAEIIERCSYGVDLYPGDVIASGKPANGCFLNLNKQGVAGNKEYPQRWLQAGDTIDMEIEMLGKLSTTIVAEETDYSLFNRTRSH